MPSYLARKPAFWIVVLLASAVCVFSVLHWFGDAFSVLDLDVRMSRDEAIHDARRLVAERALNGSAGADVLIDAVASFDGDAAAQTFIELEGGGKPALKPLLGGSGGNGDRVDRDGDHRRGSDDRGGPGSGAVEDTLYKWRVRLYAPDVEREVQVAFTPAGQPAGFAARVPEAEAGAALSADDARAIAVTAATRDWGVDFSQYRALTASAAIRPGKRVDHEFVYERKLEDAPSIGAGRLRLRLVVAGDRLIQLQRYVFVPEAFARRYETMRSLNNLIATGASVVAGLLYGLGGCLIGLVWLMRRHAVRWGPSTRWAGVVALLITGAGLASISGSWFGYDTATSASTHLTTGIGAALVGGVFTWLALTVVFATAEGLGRLAFGAHPQLWRTWRVPSANSRAIWGRTLAGYAWIGFDLAFIALFYFVVQRYLGWWSPSDSLVDPNILGTPQPWIGPVSMALQAGMMEESLFRAIPLAGAALLGRHFGREKTFIGVALVLQAIVFGCAHANYPGQPAFVRPVELFLPALVWGVVYLRYGLVPGMLFHFGFDLVLMSIPLFVTVAPGLGFDRAMVVGIFALPLVVLIVQRLRAGRLIDLPASERNAAAASPGSDVRPVDDAVVAGVDAATGATGGAATGATAGFTTSSPSMAGAASAASAPLPSPSSSTPSSARTDGAPRTWRDAALLGLFVIVGAIGLGLQLMRPYDAPGLSVSRDQAVALAEKALAERGVVLDDRWRRSAKAIATGDDQGTRFVWREGGKGLYDRLVDRTLPPPHWEVRFACFDGDVAERDSWRVSVVDGRPAPDGIRLIEHDLPEARPGKKLSEAEARPVAEAAIARWLRLPASALRPVSARSTEQPARVDWLFVYSDTAVALPAGGEARIAVEIDGDEVAGVGRSLFIPDAWSRDQRHRNERLIVPRALLGLLATAFAICGLISLVRRLARGEASKRAAGVGAVLLVGSSLAAALLGLNATEFGFTIAEPFDNQRLHVALQVLGLVAAGGLVGALVAAVGVRLASRTEDPGPVAPGASRIDRWAPAVAIALLATGAGGWTKLAGAPSLPRLPSVAAANALSPLAAAMIGELAFAVVAAAVILAAAVLSTRRRRDDLLIGAGFAAAALLARASVPDAGPGSIVLAGLAGLAGWWIYRRWLRDRPGVIAPTLLCGMLLGGLVNLAHDNFPGARVATLGGLVATLAGYAIWRWLVKADEVKADDPRSSAVKADAVRSVAIGGDDIGSTPMH